MNKYEKIGSRLIYLDELYFIAYAGGKRELSEKDQKEYNKTLHLPYQLQHKERQKIPLEKNPNVIPIKGRDLISFIKELKFVPFFDVDFSNPRNPSRLLKLTDIVIFESMKQKSYETALKS
jgi:hypothetical protein